MEKINEFINLDRPIIWKTKAQGEAEEAGCADVHRSLGWTLLPRTGSESDCKCGCQNRGVREGQVGEGERRRGKGEGGYSVQQNQNM